MIGGSVSDIPVTLTPTHATKLLAAAEAADRRSRGAQDASGLEVKDPYGHTFKCAFPEEVRIAFQDVPGYGWVSEGRAGTLLVDGMALIPLRGQIRQGECRASYSPARAELVSKRSYPRGEVQLEISVGPDDEVTTADRPQLLAVAVADPTTGVSDVLCGQGIIQPNDLIVWDWNISMSTLAASQAPLAPVGVRDGEPAWFGEGPIPETTLELRAVGEPADASEGAAKDRYAGAGDARR